MARAIFCVAQDPSHASRIVDDLKIARFASGDVSVLLPESAGANASGPPDGTLGWLASVGSLLAAGPLTATPANDGTVAGLAGALFSAGIPEFQAKRYEAKVKGGNALVALHARDAEELTRGRAVMERAGAEDISISGEIAVPNALTPDRRSPDRRSSGESEGHNPRSCAHGCAEEES
jgi:hypothetical protein